MSLRLRLFLLFGALLGLLAFGQWLLVRSLSQQVTAEVGEIAISLGRSLAEGRVGEIVQHKVKVIRKGEGVSEGTGLSYSFEGRGDGTEPRAIVLEGEAGAGGESDARSIVLVTVDGQGPERSLVVGGGAGAQRIPIPERGVQREVFSFGRRLLLGSLALFGLGLVGAAVLAHRIARPMTQLATAAERVGKGELGLQAAVPPDRETGAAVRAFNHMSLELERLDRDAKALRGREHLAELGEMSRGLAHSLRNPLHALGLTVDELAAGAAGMEGAELAETARRQIRRIDRTVRSMLVLAAETDTRVPHEPVELAALCQDVALEALQDFKDQVGIEVEVAGGAREPRIVGVGAELRAMIHALVINACEASPAGERVFVRLASGPDRAVIEVLDRGPGLAAEVRDKLFSPHVSTKPTGAGMGLFLCRRLATSCYAGDLALEDRAGGGTLARLTLGDRISNRGGADA